MSVRVLSILPFSPPSPRVGGAERQMHALHRALRARGVDVQVLADADVVGMGRTEADGVPVWGVPLPALTGSPWRPGNLRGWRRARGLLRTVAGTIGAPDLIQATPMRQPALWAQSLSRALGVPWVGRVACSGSFGDLAFMRGNWQTRRGLGPAARGAAAVVVLDGATATEAAEAGVPVDRIVRIPNAVALSRVPSTEEAMRAPVGGTILFVGRMSAQKRVDDLVRAYALLAGRLGDALPPLELVGGGDSVDAVARAAEDAGGEVRMRGAQAGPEAFLAEAACFVNPSESEGFPNAVLEACAFGVPVVLSDLPVHREIARATGCEAFLFPVGDAAALADALERFLRLPADAARALRRRAAEFAAGFTPAARDDAYLALYERVLAGRRA